MFPLTRILLLLTGPIASKDDIMYHCKEEAIMISLSPLSWLALGAVLMALEVLVPGFIIFWFGLGSMITAALAKTGVLKTDQAQWLFFFISSLAFLGLWFGWLKKVFRGRDEDDQRDPTLFNLRGRCTARIEPGIPGQVELYEPFHGLRTWQAESGDTIEKDEEVQVLEARGIKLMVKRFEGRG